MTYYKFGMHYPTKKHRIEQTNEKSQTDIRVWLWEMEIKASKAFADFAPQCTDQQDIVGPVYKFDMVQWAQNLSPSHSLTLTH